MTGEQGASEGALAGKGEGVADPVDGLILGQVRAGGQGLGDATEDGAGLWSHPPKRLEYKGGKGEIVGGAEGGILVSLDGLQ